MDAHEFYLYFGASYVLICQLELKLWNHNYKHLFKLARFLLCIYNQKYTTISNTRATFAYYSFCDNLRQWTSQSAVIVGCHF